MDRRCRFAALRLPSPAPGCRGAFVFLLFEVPRYLHARSKVRKLAKPAAKPAAKKVIKPAAPAAKAAAEGRQDRRQPRPRPPQARNESKPVPATKSRRQVRQSHRQGRAEEARQGRRRRRGRQEEARPPAQGRRRRGRRARQGRRQARPQAQGRRRSARPASDVDLSDIEDDLAGEAGGRRRPTEKVKPLRMKISKAKERALMKEFGLDETVLSEEEMAKRRQRLKTLITLGKTRGYLTHGEITDHLPDKLVDAETLEVVVTMLNDLGVAVYEQTPDAETLLLNNTAPTAATVEEAEEEAEAALSTVDSEFGRTTDPVRMYMREMGTVELLTREGEIEIAKRIEGGLMAMMEAISRLARHHRRDPAPGRRNPRRQGRHLHRRRRLLQPQRGRRLRGRGRLRRVRRGRRRRRQGRLQGADQEARRAQDAGAGALRPHRRAVREGPQDLRQGRLRHAGLREGAARPVRRADDHPLHGQDHREAVRHGARPGRRRAQEGARAAPHHRGQVRHAAGNLHQGLPAQPAEPEVGREAGRRRQALERRASRATSRRSRNCSRS